MAGRSEIVPLPPRGGPGAGGDPAASEHTDGDGDAGTLLGVTEGGRRIAVRLSDALDGAALAAEVDEACADTAVGAAACRALQARARQLLGAHQLRSSVPREQWMSVPLALDLQ